MRYRAAWVAGTLAVAAYAQTIGFEFTYDDHAHIEGNPMLADLGNLRRFLPGRYFDTAFPDQGRPMLVLSHFLDRAVAGSGPAGPHAQNVLWHAAASVLVFFLVLRASGREQAAALAAALFALHPIHVEAVANVSNREDLLVTVFTLATVLLGLEALRRGRPAVIVAAALAYALALGSKESGIVAPILLALVWVILRRDEPVVRRRVVAVACAFALAAGGWATFQSKLGFPSLAPFAGGTGLERASIGPRLDALATPAFPTSLLAPTAMVLMGAAADEPPTPPPSPARSLYGSVRPHHALSIIPFYATRLVVPWPLRAEYDFAPFRQTGALAAGALALVALAAAFVWGLRRRPDIALGIGWFAVAVLPVSVPSILLNPVAERYLYLPSVAVAWFGGVVLSDWLSPSWRPRRVVTLGLLALFAVLTVTRSAVWANDIVLFEDCVLTAPRSARAWHNLGAARLRRGDLHRARLAFDRALRLDPGWTAAHFALGQVAIRSRRSAEAERHWRAVLSSPTPVGESALRDAALRALGTLLARRGRIDEALSLVDAEVSRRPLAPEPHVERGRLLLLAGRPAEAGEALDRASALGDRSEALEALRDRARAMTAQPGGSSPR